MQASASPSNPPLPDLFRLSITNITVREGASFTYTVALETWYPEDVEVVVDSAAARFRLGGLPWPFASD